MKWDKQFFLVLLAVAASAPCLSQDYIVTIQGDTIVGEVKALTYGPDKKVQIIEPGKKKTVYQFFKIRSFSIDNQVYQPVKGPEGYTFMKLIKPGYLSLFSFQSGSQNLYDAQYLLKRDGTGTEVPNITFKKGMKRFLDDCPEVAEKIDKDILNKKDLHQIIDEYNRCMDEETAHSHQVAAVTGPKSAAPPEAMAAWTALENKVKSQSDFPEKENALEMISEIKSKISSAQKIPNFLIEGLKSSLPQDEFKAELDNALKEIK
jgi:hypothetical protein